MQISLNIEALSEDTPLPPLYRVRQIWQAVDAIDPRERVAQQLAGLGLVEQIRPGMRIAVTAGSRGIRDIVPVTRAAVDWLRAHGAEPFIVPAMGSHGGATAEGQTKLLASLGITAEAMGCPIHATMDVVELGRIADGTPVFMDRFAYEADGVLAINRIKAHTSFQGPIESGLAKICAVGLGKRPGAETAHRTGVYGLKYQVVPMARMVIERGKVLGGLAIIEDAREHTADIVGLPPAAIGAAGETALLERSKQLMARLPFERLDVLVVDEIGKNVSGTGMDTNVIGRLPIPGEPPPTSPIINVIVVLDLTPETHGNANGIGLADLTTAHLAQQIDFRTTYINTLTAGLVGLCKGGLPITLPTMRDAVSTAVKTCGQPDPAAVRLARIRNTLLIEELLITPALLEEAQAHPGLEVLGPVEWRFAETIAT
jgi:hypothetical protein